MRIRCKYCKTWFDTKDKYCPYCYARVRENDSVSLNDGRAKAAIFRHADSHLEQNSKYVRETGKEAKPCTANMVNDPYSKSAGHSNTHSSYSSANSNRYAKTANSRSMNERKPVNRRPANRQQGNSISKIIGWVIIIYVLIQVFSVLAALLFF
ncbi:hypothetical protein [Dielma fastidiosa]|uniref:hypothetical protein n=1 Tax=Dielma fastidiosa TaxID=1034346 RepID=UPI0023EFEF63|nr:hypothetical protein [Dielma fastidiosa]